MAVGFGQNAWVGFGEESTYGTGVAPTKHLEILSENFAGKQSYISKPALRSISRSHRVRSKKSVEGGFKFQFPFNGAERILKHALGGGSTAGPTLGAYTHSFVLAANLPTGLTFHVNRDTGNVGGNSQFRYEGCQIAKLTLSQAAEDFLQMSVDVIGEDWSLIAPTSPTFPTFVGADWSQLVVNLGGDVVAAEDFELTIDNNLAADRFKLGQLTRKGLGRSGPRSITGKMTIEFESLTEYNNFLNMTTVDMTAVWTGSVLGSTTYQLSISLPSVNLTGDDPTASDSGPIKLPLAFEAYMSSTAEDELAISLRNNVNAI